MNTQRRTFLDYFNDYSDSFYDYVKMFLNWVEVHGYISNIFVNSIYVYSINSELYNSELLKSCKEDEIKKQLEKIEYEIALQGYRSELFRDYKSILIENIETINFGFCNIFVELLFPEANYNRSIKESTIEDVVSEFVMFAKNSRLITNEEDLELFKLDFDMFLKNIPYSKTSGKGSNEYGYILLKNIGIYYQDIGVLVYNKTNLSDEILFYQIADDN